MEEVKEEVVNEVTEETEEVIEGAIVDETGTEINVDEHEEFNDGKGEEE